MPGEMKDSLIVGWNQDVRIKMKRLDPLTSEQRSERMSRVRNSDTKPEMIVRRIVHGMGYRYRLHSKKLTGHPDIVLASRKKVIFVNGCFWHQHGCNHYRMPKSRKEFWEPKLRKNVERDKYVRLSLEDQGWSILTIWECELKDIDVLRQRIRMFIEEKKDNEKNV
jgi:DNA mismatch endonuclease (patch repair protein)